MPNKLALTDSEITAVLDGSKTHIKRSVHGLLPMCIGMSKHGDEWVMQTVAPPFRKQHEGEGQVRRVRSSKTKKRIKFPYGQVGDTIYTQDDLSIVITNIEAKQIQKTKFVWLISVAVEPSRE